MECLKLVWEEATKRDKNNSIKNNSIRNELRRVVNIQDKTKNTALHYATQLWPQDVVRYILELGANIGVKNIYEEVR